MKKPKMPLQRKLDVVNDFTWRLQYTVDSWEKEEDKDKKEFAERLVTRFYESVAKEIGK